MIRISCLAFFLTLTCYCDSAAGQLFGSRSVKRSLNRQGGTGVGTVQGNERFVRGRRDDSFVGTNQGDLQGFVGMEQARTSGQIASPTGGIKQFVDLSSTINTPYPQLKKSDVYPGAIVLPMEIRNPFNSPKQVSQLNSRLNVELRTKVSDSIEVSVVNRIASLRGEVSSSAKKVLAELLVGFEPGIDEIDNQIVIVDP